MPSNIPPSRKITTIERHILDEQQSHPEATGALTGLLYDLALAGKVIADQMNRAGLAEILGLAGQINVQGEDVMKVDLLADETIRSLNTATGRLAAMVSEEHAEMIPIPEGYPTGKYVLLFDPLDGSSNIDFNVSIGTVFAIHQRKSADGPGTLEDCLQRGRDLVAAGYIIYSASTMLVYSSGHGVHGFTLDPNIGEFILSHPNIRIPARGGYYSVDQGYEKVLERGHPALHAVRPRWWRGHFAAVCRISCCRFSSHPAFRRDLLLSCQSERSEPRARQVATSI